MYKIKRIDNLDQVFSDIGFGVSYSLEASGASLNAYKGVRIVHT